MKMKIYLPCKKETSFSWWDLFSYIFQNCRLFGKLCEKTNSMSSLISELNAQQLFHKITSKTLNFINTVVLSYQLPNMTLTIWDTSFFCPKTNRTAVILGYASKANHVGCCWVYTRDSNIKGFLFHGDLQRIRDKSIFYHKHIVFLEMVCH